MVLCSGPFYFDLIERRDRESVNDVAVVRVEEIAPFPYRAVRDQIDKYPNARVIWAQEESQNAGAWTFVDTRIRAALGDSSQRKPEYYGRETSSSPATGRAKIHESEKDRLLDAALGITDVPPGGIGPDPNYLYEFTNGMHGDESQ